MVRPELNLKGSAKVDTNDDTVRAARPRTWNMWETNSSTTEDDIVVKWRSGSKR